MRKAGLLDKKPLTATNRMLSMAAGDTGKTRHADGAANGLYYRPRVQYTEYQSRYYFRAQPAAVENILEVDLFTRKDLADGRREPRFRIFLDYGREDFISWNTADEKWSSAKIDMLDTGDYRYTYSYRGRNHASKETLKLVNGYLHAGNMQDVEASVINFQAGVRGVQLGRKHRLITDMIDGYMDTVPDRLPADWMKFINRTVLQPGHCILYRRGEKQGWCTCCRLHVPVPADVKHNMPGKCTCGSRIAYKSWEKQKSIRYDTKASVIQKCTDGQNFVYRQFNVGMRADREKEYVPEITSNESIRYIFDIPDTKSPLRNMGQYEWGCFKQTGIERWCEAGTVNHRGFNNGYYYGQNFGYAGSVLYTPNLKRIFRGTGLQYVPAAEIIKGTGKRLNVMAALGDINMHFPYEAFWKMGLKRFVRERVENDGTEKLTRTDYRSAKPWQYLKITKEDMKQAVRLDATDQQMRIIQRAAETGVKLSDAQVMWLDRYAGVSALMAYFSIQTPHRVIRYLQETVGLEKADKDAKDRLQLWTDYLDTAGQLEWDLRDRQVFFPQNIQRAHDEAVNVFTIRKDREAAEKMKATDRIMHRNARQIKKAFCYRNKEFMISVPGCYLDFRREGHAQHNCVATYYEKAVRGECIILFIRKRKSPKEAFCTVEIQNRQGRFTVVQNRAAYNADAPAEAKKFMEAAVGAAQRIADGTVKEEKEETRIRAAV